MRLLTEIFANQHRAKAYQVYGIIVFFFVFFRVTLLHFISRQTLLEALNMYTGRRLGPIRK